MTAKMCLRTVLLTGFYLLAALPVADAQYAGGSGVAEDPFQIASADDLIALGARPENYDKHFILTADIDLDPNLAGGKVFERAVVAPDANDAASGFQGNPFVGSFDGNGRVIRHLHIQGSGYLGLFGLLGTGAAISNLGLEAVDVNGTATYVAGLVAYNDNGSISESYSTGAVAGNSGVGGLVGSNRGSLSRGYSSALVDGSTYVGGLAGHNGAGGSIANSRGIGCVTGDSRVGGLVGSNDSNINASLSSGTVDGGSGVGGLVGYNGGRVAATYSVATASGRGVSVGGLVGHNAQGATVVDSYCTGAVTGSAGVGGLVGANDGNVTRSFWDTETSGQIDSAGGTGLTTTLMQDVNIYLEAGWDFVDESANGTQDLWRVDEWSAYPRLWWEPSESAEAVAVYRLWSATSERHFDTIDEAERADFLEDPAGAWEDEGVVYYAFASDSEPNVLPIYRFYAASLDSYFYTISERERDKLVADFADVWTYERIAFYAFPEGGRPVDTVPVYRFWSATLGCHFYTIDEDEKDRLLSEDANLWTDEGIAWYAYAPAPPSAES